MSKDTHKVNESKLFAQFCHSVCVMILPVTFKVTPRRMYFAPVSTEPNIGSLRTTHGRWCGGCCCCCCCCFCCCCCCCFCCCCSVAALLCLLVGVIDEFQALGLGFSFFFLVLTAQPPTLPRQPQEGTRLCVCVCVSAGAFLRLGTLSSGLKGHQFVFGSPASCATPSAGSSALCAGDACCPDGSTCPSAEKSYQARGSPPRRFLENSPWTKCEAEAETKGFPCN